MSSLIKADPTVIIIDIITAKVTELYLAMTIPHIREFKTPRIPNSNVENFTSIAP